MTQNTEIRALVVLPTTDLTGDLGFFGKTLKMQMDMIYPADDPTTAVFSGHGLRVRLERGAGAPGQIVVATDVDFAD